MVSAHALERGSSGPGSSSAWDHCVVTLLEITVLFFVSKKKSFCNHNPSLNPGPGCSKSD